MEVAENKAQIEANALSALKKYVKNYKIFIDTCSLLYEHSDEFMQRLVPILKSNGAKLYVAVKVVAELQKHSKNKENAELREGAIRQLAVLQKLTNEGVIGYRGSEKELNDKHTFADAVFFTAFSMLRLDHQVLFITQDRALAKDIMNMNGQKSIEIAKDITVKRINKYGFLSNIEFEEEDNTSVSNPKTTSASVLKSSTSAKVEIPENQKFAVCKKVTSVPNNVIPVSHLPVAGDIVKTSSNRQVRLGELIGEGGEGCVYGVDESHVAKIYHKECIKQHTYEKIKRMIDKKLHCEGICFPTEMIYNANNQFVGYIMPKARGKEFAVSVFKPNRIIKLFPDGKKRQVVELALTVLEKIKYLHDRNILMGDINGRNFLVNSSKEVYFVDTDSYQIEDLPCRVGTPEFTPPELQNIKYEEVLRTKGNENFAVATLLFMMMLPGKLPYAHQASDDPNGEKSIAENIKDMDFPYPCGESSTGKAPDGPWRDMWSHLPRYLKELFYKTFRKGEEFASEKTRPGVEGWIKAFESYISIIDNGKLAQNDPMSLEIRPTRGKLHENVDNKNCALCGKLVPVNQMKKGICKECQRTGEVYRCNICNRQILYSNLDRLMGKKRHPFCESCYKKKYGMMPLMKAYPAPAQISVVNGQMMQTKRPASRLTLNPTSTRPPATHRTSAYRQTYRPSNTPSYTRPAYNQYQYTPQQNQQKPQKPKGRFNKKIAGAIVAIGGYMAFKTFGFAVIPLAILAVVVHHIRKDM